MVIERKEFHNKRCFSIVFSGIILGEVKQMKKERIIFMGTPEFACAILKQLIDDRYSIVAVVSQPDKKVGRKQVVEQTPVKELALQHNILVLQPLQITKDYQAILDLQPDVIITCAYGQFIPTQVLEAPTYGSINVHASLLPKLRGGAPIHWAIINGEQESGVSIMRMIKKMDAGAVMAQSHVAILPKDTTGTLYDKLKESGAKLLHESLPKLIDGTATFVDQDETQATFGFNIKKEEEKIDFDQDATIVYNHIRGLIPTPAGYALLQGKKVKFHKVHCVSEEHSYASGELIGWMDDGYAIAAKHGFIIMEELQIEGKGKIDAKAFYNGNGKAWIGQRFT